MSVGDNGLAGYTCPEERLANFVSHLREEGIPVGTAELMDAIDALASVDLSKRENFKTALQATLVKGQRYRDAFEEIFNRYFISPETWALRSAQQDRSEKMLQSKLQEADRALQFKGESLQLSRDEMLIYTSLPDRQREGLLRFVRETEGGKKVERQFRPLLETVVKGQLRYWRSRMEQVSPDGSRSGSAGEGAGSGRGEETLADVDMGTIRESDLPVAEALLEKLSRQLARKLQRRYRHGARRGPLDFPRTIRDNMRYGGSIFKLRYKQKRRPQDHLLLLCDVSASMKRYSKFVLQFVYGLQSAVHNLESFCFADSLEYLSPDLKGPGHLQKILERIVYKGASWGGGTNLAAALDELLERYRTLLTARTTVVVVSDTRTIALDSSLRKLQEMKLQVARVIWLNTLRPDHWSRYRSVNAVEELVEMWPCSTITQLEQVVSGRLLKPAYLKDRGGILP